MSHSTVRSRIPNDELRRSWANQVGATLPPLPSSPVPNAPSLFGNLTGSEQMFPYSTFGRSSLSLEKTCKSPFEAMAMLGDTGTEAKSPMLGEGGYRVWIYGIPPHWTVSKIQEILSDLTAEINIINYTPVGKDRIMPDDRYTWQKRDCEITFKDRSAAQRCHIVFPFSTEAIQARCLVASNVNDQTALVDEASGESEPGTLIELYASSSVHSPTAPTKGSSECSLPLTQIAGLYNTIRPYGPLIRITPSPGRHNDIVSWTWNVLFTHLEDAEKFRFAVKSGIWQGRPSVKDLGFHTWAIRGYRDCSPVDELMVASEETPCDGNYGPPTYLPKAPSPPVSMARYPSPTKPVQAPVPWAKTTGPDSLNHCSSAARPTQKSIDSDNDTVICQSGETLTKYRDSLPKDSTWRVHGTRSPDGSFKSSGIHAVVESLILTHRPGRYIVPCLPEDRGDFIDLATLRISPLAPDTTSHFLKNVFSSICPDHRDIISIRVMLDAQGRSRGFGFVSFRNPEGAADAKAKLLDIGDPSGLKLSSIKYPQIQLGEVLSLSKALPSKSVLPDILGLQSAISL